MIHDLLKRMDTELEQSLLRLLLGSAAVASIVFFTTSHHRILIGYSVFLVLSILHVLHVYLRPGVYVWRRILGQLIDMSAISTLFFLTGETAVIGYGVYLWVILGNGFRFGVRYLASALAIGTTFFLVVVFNGDFFVQHKFVSTGLVLAQLIVPAYFAFLLRRLNAASEELKYLSTRDCLTGLLNRRAFDEIMSKEFSRLKRHSGSFALAVVDIDFFKKVNDVYGHYAGDVVIQHVAGILMSSCRSMDSISRFGGEEFTLLFPDLDPEKVRMAGERIRSAVESSATIVDEHSIVVTVSVGFALWDDRYSNVDAWFNSADTALYRAKHEGRNQVVIADHCSYGSMPEEVGQEC